ncbi:MAG: hypothetical protein JKY37_17980 [Nannocystaceae bacterium]|nr:hypothetical protein [Nannocystaceae bacterium]
MDLRRAVTVTDRHACKVLRADQVNTTANNYSIRRMVSDGLLAQLGLRPGDTILALDGKDMADADTISQHRRQPFPRQEDDQGLQPDLSPRAVEVADSNPRPLASPPRCNARPRS